MVEYAVPTLNQLPWVKERHLPSLDFSLFSTVSLIVNELDSEKYAISSDFSKKYPMDVYYSDDNLGVSASWNFFISQAMDRGAKAIVIANDDIEHQEGLADLCAALEDHPFAYLDAPQQNAFSCFGMQLSLVRYVGNFDEEFSPAYFEDNDFAYRLRLAGIELHAVPGNYFHCGSATLGKFDWTRKQMHHHNFRKNAEYYVRKWGGMPGDEQYTVPFQNG